MFGQCVSGYPRNHQGGGHQCYKSFGRDGKGRARRHFATTTTATAAAAAAAATWVHASPPAFPLQTASEQAWIKAGSIADSAPTTLAQLPCVAWNSAVISRALPATAGAPPLWHNIRDLLLQALYDFDGEEDTDLTMSKGDVLIVVDDSNPDWWDAKVASAPERHGFVPSNYVELIVGGAGDMPIYSELDDHWERKQAEFQLKKRIGYGQFGEVWLGSWNEATPEVAVKKLKPKTTRASLEHEFNILKALRHPNLLKLHGVCTAVEPFYIVTEFMKNGTLFDYLNGKGSAIRLKQILDMASKSIIHNFLSARTIMVGGATATAASRVCKVGSFAFARKLQGGSSYEAPDGARYPGMTSSEVVAMTRDGYLKPVNAATKTKPPAAVGGGGAAAAADSDSDDDYAPYAQNKWSQAPIVEGDDDGSDDDYEAPTASAPAGGLFGSAAVATAQAAPASAPAGGLFESAAPPAPATDVYMEVAVVLQNVSASWDCKACGATNDAGGTSSLTSMKWTTVPAVLRAGKLLLL
eukprot:gene8023-24966_t